METSSDDELLIMNKSGFYMCPVCGYSDIVKRGHRALKAIKKHKNFRQFDCQCDELNYLRLGHKFQTDIARFTIPLLNSADRLGYPQALSFLYTFLEGISIALGIERNDIDGVLEMNLEYESYDILLYDNVPGGAGHVKRMLGRDAVIGSLRAGLEKINQECCDENTSCYSCLRNYYNQSYHNILQRKLAIDVVRQLLSELKNVSETYRSERWDRNVGVRSSDKMKLVLGKDGRNPGNESAEEIWEDLLEDCFDEDEISLIEKIKESSPEYIARPYYSKTIEIEETSEKFVANLIWDSKQVILFLNDAYDDYLVAQKTGWDVFCTKDGFGVKEFLDKVGE